MFINYVLVEDAAEQACDACSTLQEVCTDEIVSKLESGLEMNKVWKAVKEKAPRAVRRPDSGGKVIFNM